ncbi:MAG: DNA translocase FtsK [Thermomicrobiales bacterium]
MPLFGKVRKLGHGLTDFVPELALPDRLRREITGGVALLLALLSAWALGSAERDGRIVEWSAGTLNDILERGGFLVPLMLFMCAIRAFRRLDEPILLPRHYLGSFGLAVAVVGLLELAAAEEASGGGALGAAVATLLTGGLGDVGAGPVLFVVGCFGIFLLAGTDVLSLWNELKMLWPRRPPAELVAAVAMEPSAQRIRRSATSENPVPEPPGPPIINLPAMEAKTLPASAPMKIAPVTSGEPLPLPEVDKLALYEGVTLDTGDLEARARRIEDTLASFKVDARVREINPGPAVTQFTLEPGPGIKVRRITELQNDLALALAAPSIRIEAPIPGMARVGVEIPNEHISIVGLRETLESVSFQRSKAKLPVPLGRDVNGRYVVGDLARMPHLLIAGATGSGKSICLNSIISTFFLTRGPDELKLLMIDPKMVELTGYNGVPHLQCPVVTERDKVVGALRLIVQEMERRYTLFQKIGVRNLDGYRMKVADEPRAERMPYLVVIIDELADLMMTAPDEVETLLVRLAQMARATGIHLIIATQRPTVDVLTGLIKANVPARIAFAVTSLTDSRVILDMPGAERLLGQGDMLFLPPDAAKPVRIQGALIEDKDVHYVVSHWHKVAPVPHYAQEWLDLPSSNAPEEDASEDPLFEQAMDIVRREGTASASMLQRRLRIGYNRAARLIEQMEDDGVIGPSDGIKPRTVLTEEE